MRVAIITFVRAYNYGAVLQAYALNRIISNFDIDCRVIDYYPAYFYKQYHFSNQVKLRIKPSRSPMFWWNNNTTFFNVFTRCKKFDKFIRKYIRKTEQQFCSYDDLKNCNCFDIYISGSDQVWNPGLCKFDESYYLTFCKNKKRYSYAASFGMKTIPEKYKSEIIRRLSNWNGYSVREMSGKELLYELTGEKAVCCCDPTLLLSSEEWRLLVSSKKKNDYILIYFVDEAKYLLECGQKLAEQFQMDVYCIHSSLNPEYYNRKYFYNYKVNYLNNCSPKDFINLFANANYVITDSFHGTIFSVVFHKQFLTRTKMEDNTVNERISSFLKDLCIVDRDINIEKLTNIDNAIDWEKVERNLERFKKDSLEYIKRIVT